MPSARSTGWASGRAPTATCRRTRRSARRSRLPRRGRGAAAAARRDRRLPSLRHDDERRRAGSGDRSGALRRSRPDRAGGIRAQRAAQGPHDRLERAGRPRSQRRAVSLRQGGGVAGVCRPRRRRPRVSVRPAGRARPDAEAFLLGNPRREPAADRLPLPRLVEPLSHAGGRAAAIERAARAQGLRRSIRPQEEPDFVVFLTTFARNTRVSSMSPTGVRRRAAHAVAGAAATPRRRRRTARTDAAPPRARKPAVFISYSRSDIAPGANALRRDPARRRRRRRLVRQVGDRSRRRMARAHHGRRRGLSAVPAGRLDVGGGAHRRGVHRGVEAGARARARHRRPRVHRAGVRRSPTPRRTSRATRAPTACSASSISASRRTAS